MIGDQTDQLAKLFAFDFQFHILYQINAYIGIRINEILFNFVFVAFALHGIIIIQYSLRTSRTLDFGLIYLYIIAGTETATCNYKLNY